MVSRVALYFVVGFFCVVLFLLLFQLRLWFSPIVAKVVH